MDKQSFWDSVNIRYDIPPKRISSLCVCEAVFKLEHALSRAKGGFMLIRENEVRDFRACITTTNRWNSTTTSNSIKWSSCWYCSSKIPSWRTTSVLQCEGVTTLQLKSLNSISEHSSSNKWTNNKVSIQQKSQHYRTRKFCSTYVFHVSHVSAQFL